MISTRLEQIEASMTDERFQELQQAMQDIYMVSELLQECKHPGEVLPYLYVEVSGCARPSFINRIYGRYRKLLPKEDLRVLTNWAKHNRRKNEKPGNNN